MYTSTTTEDPDEAHRAWNQSQPWLGWHWIPFYPPKQKGASFKEKWYKPKRVGIRVAMNWKNKPLHLLQSELHWHTHTHTHTHTHYKVMSTHSCQGSLYLAAIFVILGNMVAGTKFSLVNWLSAITLSSGGVLPNFVQEPSDLTHNSGVSILTTLNRTFLFVTLQIIHWDQKHSRNCKGIPPPTPPWPLWIRWGEWLWNHSLLGSNVAFQGLLTEGSETGRSETIYLAQL